MSEKPRPVDSLADLEERLALWCQFVEPLPLVKYASVRELLTASLYYIRQQRNSFDALTEANKKMREALAEIETICAESAGDCRKRMGTRVGNALTTARAALKVSK